MFFQMVLRGPSEDQELLDVELQGGRQCSGGDCREQCSLVVLEDGF